MSERWINTAEAARRLSISAGRVRQLLQRGKLAGRRRGKRWQVDASACATFAKANRQSKIATPRGGGNGVSISVSPSPAATAAAQRALEGRATLDDIRVQQQLDAERRRMKAEADQAVTRAAAERHKLVGDAQRCGWDRAVGENARLYRASLSHNAPVRASVAIMERWRREAERANAEATRLRADRDYDGALRVLCAVAERNIDGIRARAEMAVRRALDLDLRDDLLGLAETTARLEANGYNAADEAMVASAFAALEDSAVGVATLALSA